MPQHTLRGLRPGWWPWLSSARRFASAHATWVALELAAARARLELLCLSTRCVGCIVSMTPSGAYSGSLPQHTLRGLHWQKYFALFCRMCCKLVDSFSVEQRMLTALTIFPDFSAAKATYVAIIDSLGRTIDRFLWCEHPVFFLLTSTSPDAHTGRCLWHLA